MRQTHSFCKDALSSSFLLELINGELPSLLLPSFLSQCLQKVIRENKKKQKKRQGDFFLSTIPPSHTHRYMQIERRRRGRKSPFLPSSCFFSLSLLSFLLYRFSKETPYPSLKRKRRLQILSFLRFSTPRTLLSFLLIFFATKEGEAGEAARSQFPSLYSRE